MIRNDQVLTFPNDGIMNDTEMKRKTFQSVSSEERVGMIWGIVEQHQDQNGDDNNVAFGLESGSVDKLTDLMPSPAK